jgi:hypothetical protein
MFDFFRKKKSGTDFSEIDSREKAEEASRTGALMPLMLMPESFGGAAVGMNIVYVPAWAVEQKERIDIGIILPLAQAGKITKYSAQPTYKGASFIPSAIVIRAHEPGDFSATVEIW